MLFRNLNEDIRETLKRNPGLKVRYGRDKGIRLVGKYYLCNELGELIEDYTILIWVPKNYPYGFPLLFEMSKKIERDIDFHINEAGLTCVEISELAKIIAKRGISICDFVEKYVFKFFCWQLVRKHDGKEGVDDWGHYEIGTVQFYEMIFDTQDQFLIINSIKTFLAGSRPERNDPCICGSGLKLKKCSVHRQALEDLKDLGDVELIKGLAAFEKVRNKEAA